jgi:hypothetical protein
MSHWHYQLMKRKSSISDEDYYAIHEYFDLDDGPAWTENPVVVDGESVEDVKKALMLMLHDIDKHGVKDYD